LLRVDPTNGKPVQPRGPRAASGRAAGLVTLASRRGSGPVEAAFVFPKGGVYYLFVSFDNCCRGAASSYKIMVGRSASGGGRYVDRSGGPMARGGGTLVLAGTGRFRGPGSNAVISDGGRDYLVYQAYDTQNGGTPTLLIRPVSWTPDGWPVAGDP